jgi:hypothetical protein
MRFILKQPSNHRDWAPDQAVLPWVEIAGEHVTIHNIRNCAYRTAHDYDVAHYDRTFDLTRLRSVDYIVEPFASWRGPAHTFVSFGFDGPEYVAVSIEIRKVRGQSFSAWRGLFRAYEIMYVIGDERDLVKLRTNYRRDEVYLYPLRASPDGARRLFLDLIDKANRLRRHPEFYNTLTNNCTLGLMRHINKVVKRHIPFSFRLVFPGYSDRLAYDLGWIDTDLSFEEARRRFHINERAMKYADDAAFSQRIRAVL